MMSATMRGPSTSIGERRTGGGVPIAALRETLPHVSAAAGRPASDRRVLVVLSAEGHGFVDDVRARKELRLPVATYSHSALFHDTDDELVAGLVSFVEQGIEADERVVVVVSSSVGEMIRERVGPGAEFDLLNSADVYTQPVRTLGAYVETVRAGTGKGRSMRVAGQPIWTGLSPLEIAEWTCVEAACNLVFASSPLQMLCPYDTARLDPSVIAAARRTHPEIRHGSRVTTSPEFSHFAHQRAVRASELPARPATSEQISMFSAADLAPVQSFVEAFARSQGTADGRITDLALTVGELVDHVIDFRAGPARLYIWATAEQLVYEIESSGLLSSPFAGYLPPSASDPIETGLWLTGAKCDLLAVRERLGNTTMRVHFQDYLVSPRVECNGIDELLGAYVLAACDPEEMVLVDAHLATCAECRNEAARLGQVVGLMNHPHGQSQPDS